MKYSFMSFSCPELNMREIVTIAKKYGYTGIEPRIDSGHKHGIEVTASSTELKEMVSIAVENEIRICCLATSSSFANPDTYLKNLEQAKRNVDLASKVGALIIRVFGGDVPNGVERIRSFEQIIQSLSALAKEAADGNVTVCMETHDGWCNPEDVAEIMKQVGHPYIAVNWDIMHPVLTAKVSIEKSFTILNPYIKHVHIHDGLRADGNLIFKPIGEGLIDHKTTVTLLENSGYNGFLSGEWINWEPYDIHLPREISSMKSFE